MRTSTRPRICRIAAEPPARDEANVSLRNEVLTSIRRAGADLIATYHAKKAAEWLT